MNSKKKRRGQMSEAFCTAMFLSLSGGLQDAYTYCCRGKVFANAQTGNIVLMAVHAFAGEWGHVLHYLPVSQGKRKAVYPKDLHRPPTLLPTQYLLRYPETIPEQ